MSSILAKMIILLRWLLRIGLPLGFLFFGGKWIGDIAQGDPVENHKVVRFKKPEPVDVVEIQQADYEIVVRSFGNVRPRAETELVSEVEGKVEWVAAEFQSGGMVKANQPLLRVEQTEYQIALARAESELARAESALVEEQARVQRALEQWQNLRGEEEAPALVARAPQLALVEAEVTAAQAVVLGAKRDLERTEICAPFDALIAQESLALGQYVARGSKVGELIATDSFEVWLPLSQRQLAKLDLGKLLTEEGIFVDMVAYQEGEQIKAAGKAVRLAADLDEETRQQYLIVEVKGDGEGGPFRVNAFVEAHIDGRTLSDVFFVPASAIRASRTQDGGLEEQQLFYKEYGELFCLQGEEELVSLQRKQIAILHRQQDYVVIEPVLPDQFADGDLICVTDFVRVPENQPVEIRSRQNFSAGLRQKMEDEAGVLKQENSENEL